MDGRAILSTVCCTVARQINPLCPICLETVKITIRCRAHVSTGLESPRNIRSARPAYRIVNLEVTARRLTCRFVSRYLVLTFVFDGRILA
jgi:hypothetical protein